MSEAMLWGAVVRLVQAAVQAAPTLLVGLLVAGVFRYLLGHENTRRLFGAGSWRSVPRAWALGMLLPVCSIGVIPVIREMRRAGISGGTILALALSAPLFNPMSLLYGLTLSEPTVICAFAACSLVAVTTVGILWDRLYPTSAQPEAEVLPVALGVKRMTAVAAVGAREMAGGTLGYALLALAGVALLATALPAGSLQNRMNHGNPWAPLLMTVVAIPAYATPMTVIGQLGSMFKHGNSVGAAFVLLAFGAGLNLGLLAWAVRNYRLRPAAVWLTALTLVVVVLAYAVDEPLFPKDITVANHTHAFDGYCCPFHDGQTGLRPRVAEMLRDTLLPHEIYSAWAIGGFLAAGMALRLLDRRWRLETWLESGLADKQSTAWYDVRLSAPFLGVVSLAALVAFSVLGCFMYYPQPDEVLAEMSSAKIEALYAALGNDRRVAEHWITVWEDWTRRLEVGVYLRTGKLTDYQRMKSRILRDKLELLEHSLAHNDEAERKSQIFAANRAYQRMWAAFLPGNGSPMKGIVP
jgi:uncharacterized membrane protein YraQ (UPF0718 family)